MDSADTHDGVYRLGTEVEIMDSEITGTIVGRRTSLNDEDRYTVEYIDAVGNPHEKEWRASSLSPLSGDPDNDAVGELPGAEVIDFFDRRASLQAAA